MSPNGDAGLGSTLRPVPVTWLNRYRREADLSQAEFSRATGISIRTLQRLESGESENPPVRYLISCAVALELDDWHELLEEKWLQPLPGTRVARRSATRAG